MPTRDEEGLDGVASSTRRAGITDLAGGMIGTEDSVVHRRDMPGTGQEIQIAVSTPSAADMTGLRTRATTTCRRRETGGNSIAVNSIPTRTGESEKDSAAAWVRPITTRRRRIAHRTQVSSAANLRERLPGASSVGLLSLAKTLHAPREKHSAQAVLISLVEATRAEDIHPGKSAVTVPVDSTWEAGMRRRASKVAEKASEAGRVSVVDTRTAEEVTPAVTAVAANITTDPGVNRY